MDRNPHVVVIGAGLAGTALARRLAELGVPATLLGDEAHAPYNRVLLTEVLAGRYAPDVIALPGPAPGPGPGPAAPIRAAATRVDRAARRVHCADGREIPYGTLVLATGSNAVLPPLRGLLTPAGELPAGVHTFRTLDDCLALSAAAREGTRAVIVGGGLLGVSAARALAVRGVKVVLAQQAEHLMERRVGPEAARLVRRHLEGLGVEVHTECRVRGLRTVDGGVRSVVLADGYVLGTDLVVLACGVRPRTGLARAAGLTVREGVVVDDELRTSDPRVRAVGDCAEHAGRVYGLAAPALEQAAALAALLAAPEAPETPEARTPAAPYTGTRSLTRLTLPATGRGAPLDLAAFGETDPRPGDDVLRLADATRGTYRQVVVRDDHLVGGVLIGALGSVGALARAWERAEPLPQDAGSPLHLLTDHDGGH
ncbi:FAD-dependent oxidoreductase [Streptomyces sp. NPDC003717]|uniref:NAD(P)/FAD-dependent oxidoreductase n=1 Tax=Streptomyces sp. NPDC003717 TaxID=3154276 RepID=UPI0033B54091